LSEESLEKPKGPVKVKKSNTFEWPRITQRCPNDADASSRPAELFSKRLYE